MRNARNEAHIVAESVRARSSAARKNKRCTASETLIRIRGSSAWTKGTECGYRRSVGQLALSSGGDCHEGSDREVV